MQRVLFEGITLDELEQLVSRTLRNEIKNLPKPEPHTDRETYGTRKEVAKALHISLPTLYELTKTGILSGYRIQGRVLYKWREVDDALIRIESRNYPMAQ